MKILMINKFLYPNGGSETYIFELGKQLVQMGHEVQYFGMEHSGRIVGNRVGSYTSSMDFHTGKIQKIFYPFKIIYSVEARKKLRKVLDDFEPDVVHLNNFNFQLTPSVIYEIRSWEKIHKKKIRLIYTAHDYQLICPNHMMRLPLSGENCEQCINDGFLCCSRNRCIHNSKVKSILGTIEGKIYAVLGTYRELDCIICPSQFMKKKLDCNPIFASKTVVLHNFIPEVPQINSEKRNYVLYFGRYSKEKGVDTLLKVCKKLSDIPFVFAGNGPLEEEVSRVSNVANRGFLSGNELYKTIAEAAFSIYPSEWYENCPFSVMESIALGTPVVGADIGGIPELIDDRKTGMLFQSKNVEELEQVVRTLWMDGKILFDYTQNCHEKGFDSIVEYCEKLLKAYNGIG
ncbi:MAG: glycosyltransferase [Eisenbergiella sp.]